MRNVISKIFFLVLSFLLCFCSFAYADYACDLCTSLLGEDLGGKTVFSLKILRIADASQCSNSIIAARDAELAKALYSGGNCEAGLMCCQTADCGLITAVIKCDTSFVAGKIGREHGVTGEVVVSDVDVGGEAAAADLAFNQFDSTNVYPSYSNSGLLRTDGLKGYSYTVSQGNSGGKVNVNVDMWKRGGYAPANMVTALEDIGGSGGGGGSGLTEAQAKSAFTDALTDKGLSGTQLTNGVKAAMDYAHDQGYFAEGGGGGSGGGITQAEVQAAVAAAITQKMGSGLDTAWSGRTDGTKSGGGMYSPGDRFGTVKTLADSFSDFKTAMSETALFSISGSFADGAPSGGGTAPVMVINGGDTFGSHDVDFAFMSPWLLVLKGAILIGFSFAALKIITLKGGGG